MSDNTTIPAATGGDTIRDIDKGGVKTQVVALDIGGAGAESLVTPANPLPTSIASQPLPTGAATETTLAAVNAKLGNPLSVNVGLTDTQLRATAVPVSLASQPLPTGASTEATLAAMSAKIPGLGQATSANSQPVVIASDQVIPISQPLTSATGNVTTQNLVPAGAATANSAVEITLNGANALTIQTTGTYTGALSLQGTLDNANWVTLGGSPLLNVNTGGYLASITSALQSIFQTDVGGFLKARVTALAAVTGTATVTLKASPGAASMLALDAAIPPGTNSIGTVVVSSISANTPTLNTGANNVGGIVPRNVATTNGYTRIRFTSAAGLNGTVLKASAGTAVRFRLRNKSAAEVFLKFSNSATISAGTTAVAYVISIPAGATFGEDYVDGGEFFSAGISVSFSTVNSDTDTTGVLAAGDVFGFFTVI